MWSMFVSPPRAAWIYKITAFAKVSIVAALGGALFAQVAIADGKESSAGGNSPDPKTWAGIGWGLGVAADFYAGGRRVVDAQIVNGANIVRVTTDSANVGVGFVLEVHYFLRDVFFAETLLGSLLTPRRHSVMPPGGCNPPAKGGVNDNPNCTEVASGPFVAIEIGGGAKPPTDAGPITGYALGWMWGLHHPSSSLTKTSSWNFGVGLRVDPQAKVLGDGFIANRAPPPGETTVRFKTEPRYGVMLLSSFSF